jgi:hypothetical protein
MGGIGPPGKIRVAIRQIGTYKESYEKLLEELELLRDVRAAEIEIAEGEGIPHGRAKAQMRAHMPR